MSAGDEGPRDGWLLGLELPPKMTVSQWADAKRIIARGTGPEPGRWRTDRLPLTREVMDAVHEGSPECIVLMCSSQAAKTEILINIAGYYVDQDPAPQMFVLPTLELADSFSTKRFTPTVEETPSLANKVGRSASRDSSTTIREKSYPGGDIVFAGANSAASLASRPRRVVLGDEIDKYKAAIGNDGDPIEQAFQRTQNFYNRVRVLASTPTLAGLSAIEYWFKLSDQRHFHVPCPHCGEYNPLFWETEHDGGKHRHVQWDKGRPETARYYPPCCSAEWTQQQLQIAAQHGRWVPHVKEPRRIIGFHWNSLYSPWVSLADLAKEWEKADGRPEKEQTFVNLKLGLPFNPSKGARTTAEDLLARAEDYGPNPDGTYVVPVEVLMITAFVDVQADRFEVQYVGWGVNDEKWVLDYRVVWADPTDPAKWDELDARTFDRTFSHPLGGELQIEAIGIDAGYLQQRVLEFVRTRREAFRPFYAVKAMPGFGRPLWRKSEQKFKLGAELYLSGVDDGKTMTYREVAVVPNKDAGIDRARVHFPRHLALGYFEQLLSERVKVDFKAGRPVPNWHLPSGKRNEALDTFVGCVAIRFSPSCAGVDLQARRAAMSGEASSPDGRELAALFGKA